MSRMKRARAKIGKDVVIKRLGSYPETKRVTDVLLLTLKEAEVRCGYFYSKAPDARTRKFLWWDFSDGTIAKVPPRI